MEKTQIENEEKIKKLSLLIKKFGIIGTTRLLKRKNNKICYSQIWKLVDEYNIPHLSRKEAKKAFGKRKPFVDSNEILQLIDDIIKKNE